MSGMEKSQLPERVGSMSSGYPGAAGVADYVDPAIMWSKEAQMRATGGRRWPVRNVTST